MKYIFEKKKGGTLCSFGFYKYLSLAMYVLNDTCNIVGKGKLGIQMKISCYQATNHEMLHLIFLSSGQNVLEYEFSFLFLHDNL